ncbi:hypothetical protein WICPIJ_009688, partial [Wickerhamomyces pijperi]
ENSQWDDAVSSNPNTGIFANLPSKSGAAVHEEQPFNVLFPNTDSVLNEPNTTTAAKEEEEEEQSETGIDEQVDDKEA